MAAASRSQPAAASSSRCPPGVGQPVVLGAAPVLALAPFRLDEPLVLEPVEGRIERALRHVQGLSRHLPDAEQHPVAVQAVERDGLEDQEVEGAGEQGSGLRGVHVVS